MLIGFYLHEYIIFSFITNMTTTLSLTGKNNINTLNLTGKSASCRGGSTSPYYVIKFKKYIFDMFITPIMSKQWKILRQNSFILNNTIKKLQMYYTMSRDDTLILYENMLLIIKTTIDTTDELESLETHLFSANGDIAQLMYKVPRIRLNPQYELYNLIIGKPEKFMYDANILDYIKDLIKKEYITFNEIEENVKIFTNPQI